MQCRKDMNEIDDAIAATDEYSFYDFGMDSL
jgi:hypothetical protein